VRCFRSGTSQGPRIFSSFIARAIAAKRANTHATEVEDSVDDIAAQDVAAKRKHLHAEIAREF